MCTIRDFEDSILFIYIKYGKLEADRLINMIPKIQYYSFILLQKNTIPLYKMYANIFNLQTLLCQRLKNIMK